MADVCSFCFVQVGGNQKVIECMKIVEIEDGFLMILFSCVFVYSWILN